MNRQLKFRAWDSFHKKYNYENEYAVTFGGNNEVVNWKAVINFIHQLEPEQFTGLLDQCGKEIYENDIIESEGIGTFIVKFGDTYKLMDVRDGYVGWYLEVLKILDNINADMSIKAVQLNSSISSNGKVIGNIHENKELLQ